MAEKLQNAFFSTIWFLSFLSILLDYLHISNFLFMQFLDWTIFGWLVLVLTLETFLWSMLDLGRKLPPKIGLRRSLVGLVKSFLVFVGFKRRKALTKITIGILVGFLLAIIAIIIRAYVESSSIVFTSPLVVIYLLLTRYELWSILCVIPILEEIVYRGLFINRVVKIFSSSKFLLSVSAIISTSVIFGWRHLEFPEYKAFAGFVLAIIYMWGWRKNILATTTAHIVGNFTFLFLTLP